MTPVGAWERAYFAAVGLLALWVGLWGFFLPDDVEKALPFLVPPLHARFLGAMYLSGLAFMVGAVVARSWAEVRVVPPITAAWTGGLLVVSLLHTEEFDVSQPQDFIWFAAYVAYPLVAVWLIWRHRRDWNERAPGRSMPARAVTYLTVQGAVATALGLALLLAPGPMTDVWPWPISGLLAQLYSAPLLAYGIGSVLLSRQRTLAEIRICVVAMFVFAGGVLVGSLVHRELFSAGDVVDWLWFGSFGLATVALAWLSALAVARPASRVVS